MTEDSSRRQGQEFLESYRILPSFPCPTERYFEPRFFRSVEDGVVFDQCVLFHSNKICIITLSPSHPVIQLKKTVDSISFVQVGGISRLNNKVSGKFKRGGQKLKTLSPLCTVHCNDNTEYTIVSCINGTLVEVNEKLVDDPNLLVEKPWSEGYIAAVLPRLGFSDTQKNSLASVPYSSTP